MMDLEKIRKLVREYRANWIAMEQVPVDQYRYLYDFLGRMEEHIDAGKREKVMRWLGFVQGALWAHGVATVDELKAQSKECVPRKHVYGQEPFCSDCGAFGPTEDHEPCDAEGTWSSLTMRKRGVDVPCQYCGGMGVRQYSHGSTWRGGMGTASFEWDVCDVCWGTGDAHRTGVDLREAEEKNSRREDEEIMGLLSRRLGLGLCDTSEYIEMLSEMCYGQSRKRKIPDKYTEFWWAQTWDRIGNFFCKLKGTR